MNEESQPEIAERFSVSYHLSKSYGIVAAIPYIDPLTALRQKILDGKSDANISFEDLRNFLLNLEFVERVKGSHHSYRKEGIAEEPNLQRDGSKAKSY